VKPAPFELHRPERVEDVVSLLATHGDEAKPLAGGQSLVPMLALRLARFDHLVDLNEVQGLVGIEHVDGALRIGACVRHRSLERDALIAETVPLLARATPLVGHFQIRNRGTLGGSLAHADPAAELPAVAVTLDATLEVVSAGGRRDVAAVDFFQGTWTTALEADELVVAARFPVWEGRCGFAVEEVARRYGDFALVGVTCGVAVGDDGTVVRAAIGLFGVDGRPVRATEAEAALVGARKDVELAELAELAVADLDPPDDLHAPGWYRRETGAVLVQRGLVRALGEAFDA
jgi:carbon-monoxide dehydrogenase medium subunit